MTVGSPPAIPADLCGAWPNGTDHRIGVKVTLTDADPTNNDSSRWDAAKIHVSTCDRYESDGTWQQATVLEPIDYQYHDIIPANDGDWLTFTLTVKPGMFLVAGPADDFDDTRMWLYDEGLQLIEEYNDGSHDAFAQIVRSCSTDPLPAGAFYARVTENGGDAKILDYQLNFESEPCGFQSVFLPLVVRAQGTVAFSAR